ncbi:MAG: DUF359 domain-containing protein [Nitrososphaerota archaeon]|nr:DUF359 domain-containing protein [Nitrososphaerota archaeon]
MRRVFKLPENLRPKLAKPLGRVFDGEEVGGEEFQSLVSSAPMVVTVGDRVTDTLHASGRIPDVQVVDGVERRSRRNLPRVPYARLVKVKNPAGTITQGAIEGTKKAFGGKKPARVQVEGEEDLMAMLAIVLAPVSAFVFYGQPGVGVVVVRVTAHSKSRSREILAKMGIRGIF